MKIKLKTDHEKKYFRTGTVNFIKYCPVKCDRCELEKKTDTCFGLYLFLEQKTLFATELLKKMRFWKWFRNQKSITTGVFNDQFKVKEVLIAVWMSSVVLKAVSTAVERF